MKIVASVNVSPNDISFIDCWLLILLIDYWKNDNNKFVIMLKRNSIKVHWNTRPHWQLALEMRTGRPYGWFWNFLNSYAKSHDWSSWILTKCNLSWKIVKCRILSKICMINSTVSPQMWCIKSMKGWFTHPRICWQEFVFEA